MESLDREHPVLRAVRSGRVNKQFAVALTSGNVSYSGALLESGSGTEQFLV